MAAALDAVSQTCVKAVHKFEFEYTQSIQSIHKT